MTPRTQNFVVRAPNWVGDVVMATPGFRALRRAFPEARITLLARPELLPLLAGAPWFDARLPLTGHRRGVRALLRDARRLRAAEGAERAGRFDLGLCLPDSFSAALLFRLAGVARVVGYRRGLRGALLHEAVALPPGVGRRVMLPREEHVLGLTRALGARDCGTELELFVTAEEEREAARALAEHAAGALSMNGTRADAANVPHVDANAANDAHAHATNATHTPYALLAPGAGAGPAKCWPPAHFASVADALARAGVTPVLIGAPSERARADAVLAALRAETRARVINLCGALSLGALKPVVRGARALVANDSGARHIAVAFGVPCVTLLGPTALEKTGMNLARVAVLSADVACRPCYQRVCPIDHRCMTRIAPAAVVAALAPALAEEGADFRGGARVVA